MIYIPPREIEYKGEVYTVNDNALNIIETIELLKNEKDGLERAIIVVTRIFGTEAPVEQPLVDEATEILNNGRTFDSEPKKGVKEPDMDFKHDFSTIRMDVLRDYGIDILKENVKWCDLQEMVANLGENSTLNRIRQARNMDLSKIKDRELRKAWREFKEQVALPKETTKKEKVDFKQQDEYYDNLMKKLMKGG